MNEWYACDTSKKIRSTFLAKGNAGKHVASAPPYGYLKSAEDKDKWIVDEEAVGGEDRLHERQEMIRQANVYRENRECYVQYKKTKPRRQVKKQGMEL